MFFTQLTVIFLIGAFHLASGINVATSLKFPDSSYSGQLTNLSTPEQQGTP